MQKTTSARSVSVPLLALLGLLASCATPTKVRSGWASEPASFEATTFAGGGTVTKPQGMGPDLRQIHPPTMITLGVAVGEQVLEINTGSTDLDKLVRTGSASAERFRLPLALVAMDVDDFKPINDQYGHGVGDQTLIRVVEHLESCVRKSDLLARWGGDEFMVVLPKSSLDTAKELAERIRHKIKAAAPLGALNVTLSLGVVERRMGESPAALMARADQALYRSKAAGKDGVSE